MKTERSKSEQFSDDKTIFVASLFYLFLILTFAAFLIRMIGLDWLTSKTEIKEPDLFLQKIAKASLKAFELVFVYKILTRKSFVFCCVLSIVQTAVFGFIPVGTSQSIADGIAMFAIPILCRKDKLWTVVDTVFLYLLMCLYGSLSLIGKFGELNGAQIYSFYENIISVLDYKLFIVTVYLFVEYKGGIRIWKTKRKLLQP